MRLCAKSTRKTEGMFSTSCVCDRDVGTWLVVKAHPLALLVPFGIPTKAEVDMRSQFDCLGRSEGSVQLWFWNCEFGRL